MRTATMMNAMNPAAAPASEVGSNVERLTCCANVAITLANAARPSTMNTITSTRYQSAESPMKSSARLR